MIHLHFNLQLVQFFADHRTPFLTHLASLASFFGSAAFYSLLTLFLYVAWDKRFAIRLSVLIVFTMSLNHILKVLIGNPRPFVQQGTYRQKWAVSPLNASQLVAEYSTPSGHAMGSSAFYSYIAALSRNRFARVILVLAIVLIGLSRPYLGVHYVEDILLGWAIGLSIAIIAVRFGSRILSLWARCSHPAQIAIAVSTSLALCLFAVALSGHIDNQLRDLVANCGLFTGIVIAFPLELRLVNFNPRSGGPANRVMRCAVIAILMAVVLIGLRFAFHLLADDATGLGCTLQYLRYVAADVAAMLLAPFIFCRMHLATSFPAPTAAITN